MIASGSASARKRAVAPPSVRSRPGNVVPTTSWPRAAATAATRLPSIPAAPVTTTLTSFRGTSRERPLEDPDLGVVADHEPVRARLAVAATDLDVAPEQRRLHPA